MMDYNFNNAMSSVVGGGKAPELFQGLCSATRQALGFPHEPPTTSAPRELRSLPIHRMSMSCFHYIFHAAMETRQSGALPEAGAAIS